MRRRAARLLRRAAHRLHPLRVQVTADMSAYRWTAADAAAAIEWQQRRREDEQ